MDTIFSTVEELLKPSEALVADIACLEGDILILGVGGKIGPSLAKLAKQAVDASGVPRRVIGVSRLSEPGLREELEAAGVEAIAADLMNEAELAALPDAKNVLYLAGTKFGTTGKEAFTWAMNAYLPGRVAEKYRNSKIVVYSTGNVYPLVPVFSGGADESMAPGPVGEYAQSCLGRERIFEHFSQQYGTELLIYRLNYANDLRYGVLLEICKSVVNESPIDLRMGHVNVIWQGDANEYALRSFLHTAAPAKYLNITGPETAAVRWIAEEFGKLAGKTPQFVNEEAETALLNNAAESFRLFGYPKVTLRDMIRMTLEWYQSGGATIKKPTHFQTRTGKF
ncbi:NAD-dependent epimerase/dehydratase family protein [Chitinophaga deserti]|uniref:NAD-dependent epimerase/dehydratase family protein n=1 Tax=Chitinophaga deserti TaxID=2164099 RepID=UPI000D6B0787|nr:NAD(P)-dependent oxidoreductase [Chitinophaga deserti]